MPVDAARDSDSVVRPLASLVVNLDRYGNYDRSAGLLDVDWRLTIKAGGKRERVRRRGKDRGTTLRHMALTAGFVIVCLLGAVELRLHRQDEKNAPTTSASVPQAITAAPAKQPSAPQVEPPVQRQARVATPEAAGLPKTADAAPLAAASAAPTFDVVRVEPSGDTVLAGRGAPQSRVALLASGKVVAETKVDANGNFVLVPPPLRAGDHDLTLRQSAAGAAPVVSRQSVAVKVRERGAGPVIVALAEPGKATQLISAVPEAPAAQAAADPNGSSVSPAQSVPAPEPPTSAARRSSNDAKLAFRTIELENGDGFFATGIAAPGTHVEIYLNNSRIAGVTAAADGQWSVRVLKGLAGGRYIVRADAIGIARIVTARAEVAFDVPIAMAEALEKSEMRAIERGSPVAPVHPLAGTVEAGAATSAKAGGVRADAPGTMPHAASEPAGHAIPLIAAAPPAKEPPQRADAGLMGAVTPSPASPALAASAASTPAAAGRVVPRVGAEAESAVIEALETARVIGGDSLWRISRTRLGQGRRYTQIYAANAAQIRDPNRIYPNQVFVMPQK